MISGAHVPQSDSTIKDDKRYTDESEYKSTILGPVVL